jgi:hypothetical protein
MTDTVLETVLEVPKHPGEDTTLQADFGEAVPEGYSITSASVSEKDMTGATPNPSILLGVAAIATPLVRQKVTGGLADQDYWVVITGVDNASPNPGRYIQRFLLKVRETVPVRATIITSGLTQNSYVTLVQANTYFRSHLDRDAWFAATEIARAAAIVQAAKDIDALPFAEDRAVVGWSLADPTKLAQPMQFPRSYTYDANGVDIIPQEVLDAQCEQALWVISHGDRGMRREQMRIEGVASVFGRQITGETLGKPAMPLGHPLARIGPEARRLLMKHLNLTIRMVRT